MRIELGPWRPELLADQDSPFTTRGTSTTLESSSTRASTRTPYIGSTLLSYLDLTNEGPAFNVGATQFDTLQSETWGLKDGTRVVKYTITGRWEHETEFLGTTVFISGVSSLLRLRDDNGTFVTRYLSSDDELIGNAGANIFHAGTGNDRITGGAGADKIDGGAGTDTSIYRELTRTDYLVTRKASGTILVSTRDGTTDQNTSIENLDFSTGTVAASSIPYQPGFTAVPGSAVQAVFRFYNSRDKAYFYTTSAAERDMVIRESTDASFTPANGLWPYFYQGATFEQAHSSTGSVPVFRFYNTSTGHHFFTTSAAERDNVLKESTDPSYGQPGLWPFKYEGEAFRAFSDPAHRDATQVFRFYSPSLDRHFFTGDAVEAAEIRVTGLWNDEGVGFWGEIPG